MIWKKLENSSRIPYVSKELILQRESIWAFIYMEVQVNEKIK